MRVSFHGACREVTGSNILIETNGKRILFDVGFFQGHQLAEERNFAPFAYDPKSIDFVVVCHAHLDHTGRLPRLPREGFQGKIFSTAPTRELAYLVLEDSEKLMREDAKRNGHRVLFTISDVDAVMDRFEVIPYDKPHEIAPDITLTLKNAGHILGSSIAILECEGKRLVYTSDLGNSPTELLNPPAVIENADYVICETTYGGRIHEDISKRHKKLNDIILSTIAKGGVLMIPAFAIERTQELLHDIEHFCTVNNCLVTHFFLDSPLAQKATKIFEQYPEFLNSKLEKDGESRDMFGLSRVKITSSVGESKEINEVPPPKIIIAGSGMLNGGRILHHLQQYGSDPNSALLIVGYQAKGTLGRRLLDGDREVKIYGKNCTINAKILAIGSYSSHADCRQLLAWLTPISEIKELFLVHGESEEAMSFSKLVKEKLNIEATIPQQGEEYELT